MEHSVGAEAFQVVVGGALYLAEVGLSRRR